MKLSFPICYITAVTNLMLKEGSGDDATHRPAKAITFRAEVSPSQLDELRDGLSNVFFEPAHDKAPRVPAIPELGVQHWKTEYEHGTLALDLSKLEDLDFEDEHLTLGGANVKDLEFEPLSTGMVSIKGNAVVETDDAELRGKLDGLLKHTVRATFSKLTQKPLAEPEGPQDDANQGRLPIDGDAGDTTRVH